MRAAERARLATGVSLPYVVQGDPAGIPVILLHAYADSWRSFERVLAVLPAWVRALAPTQRGHGDADKPPGGYTPADFAADLEAFMDLARVDAAVVVASSSAGFTARHFAARRPGRTLGVVLVGCPYTLAGKPAVEAMRARMASLEDPVDPGFVREFVTGTAGVVDPAFLEAMVAESGAVPAHVWRRVLDGLLDPAVPAVPIACPALAIWGEDDELLERAEQERLLEAFADGELRPYPGTGHVVHWERPADVAADVAGFARRFA